jgi:hypothetical protein
VAESRLAGDSDERVFDPQLVSFNLDAIRDIADADLYSLGRGVWQLRYEDDARLGGGVYSIYVHVSNTVIPVLS